MPENAENIFKDVIDSDGQKNLTIGDFFTSEDNQLFIPDYQRPYSWDMDNINEYIKDIKNIIEQEDIKSWFMGSIYVTKLRDVPRVAHQDGAVKKLNLLDGQQRLTTIQIILWNLFFIRKFYLSHIETGKITNQDLKTDYKDLNSIQSLLLKGSGSSAKVRYITHNQLTESWEKFIKKIVEIDTREEFETYKKDFCKELDDLNGEPSAKIISKAIKSTFTTFKDYIFSKSLVNKNKKIIEYKEESKRKLEESSSNNNSDEDIFNNISNENKKFIYEFMEESAKRYINVFQAITKKSWVFKISLVDSNSSLKIFEALNNRGKGLTLTDKLRYKCLVKSSDSKKEIVRKKWKGIYENLDFLIKHNFIKNEDDLFKTFLNSHNSKDYTKESSLLKVFEDEYLNSDSKIELFCSEIEKLTNYHKIILNINTTNDVDFLKCQDDDKHNLVKALFSTFRQVIYMSDNSRIMFYSTIRKYYNPNKLDFNTKKSTINDIDNQDEKHDSIFESIWNIIKIVLCEEIIHKIKSNKTRVNYLKYGVPLTLSPKIISKIDSISIEEVLENIIFTPDSRVATFLLYLTSYLSHHESLISQNIMVSKQQLEREHMLPGAWAEHWGDMKMSDDELHKIFIDAKLDSLEKEERETINSIIKRNKFFNLTINTDERNSKEHNEKSVGQMIGNMFIIHKKINASFQNKKFSIKKPELKKSLYISIPNKDHPLIGINQFDNWDFKTIIERSFKVYSIIKEIWTKEWNDRIQ